MELGRNTEQREPVVFNLDDLPEGFRGKESGLESAFRFGHVKFPDPLQTAVARSGGIDTEGKLDMTMLGALEATADYLRDRQGQPIVLIDTVSDAVTEKPIMFSGYIATLATQSELVGLHEQGAGIAIQGGYSWLHSFMDPQDRLNTQYLHSHEKALVISVADHEFAIGMPGEGGVRSLDEDRVARQQVVAGDEIVP